MNETRQAPSEKGPQEERLGLGVVINTGVELSSEMGLSGTVNLINLKCGILYHLANL